jgi:hypothetical protein
VTKKIIPQNSLRTAIKDRIIATRSRRLSVLGGSAANRAVEARSIAHWTQRLGANGSRRWIICAVLSRPSRLDGSQPYVGVMKL